MASSGKNRDLEAESVVVGVCSGFVNAGQPSWGKTVMDRGKVGASFNTSISCSRLEKKKAKDDGGRMTKTRILSKNTGDGHQITKKSSWGCIIHCM